VAPVDWQHAVALWQDGREQHSGGGRHGGLSKV
jgi:hypothetical protein